MNKFVRNEQIETRAFEVIRDYEKKTNSKVVHPVPIEQILMQVYNLYVEWTEIEEEKEITVLGGLASRDRKIVLNTKHEHLFLTTKGLERSTIGHEAGHWEYDVDKTNLDNIHSLELPETKVYYFRASKNFPVITSFRGNLRSDNLQSLHMLKKYDLPDQARIVNRFAAAINMPIHLVKEYISNNQINSWKDFYKMKDEFEVSNSALKVRLEQFKLIYIRDGNFLRTLEEINGQTALHF